MTDKHERLLRFIDNYNGSIHIKASRYGGGWMCLLMMEEDYDDALFGVFDDMTAGDPEMIRAREYLMSKENQRHRMFVFVDHRDNPHEAMSHAFELAIEVCDIKHTAEVDV